MRHSYLALAAALMIGPSFVANASAGCHRPTCYEKVRTPDAYATVVRPTVIAPAHTDVVRTPAVRATVARQVEVAPARAWHSYSPAVYGTVERTVVVKPGGYHWQHTVDRHGRERLCKVYVAPVRRVVHQTVLLKAAERRTHVAPAVHATVHRPVIVRPATVQTTHHPAVIGYRTEQVLVRPGGHRWQPVR
jgi:hypothetical protein